MGEKPVVTYSAEGRALSLGAVLRDVWGGVVSGRYLAWRLFRREIKSDVTGSVFGYFWYFADPLVLALVFVWLRSGGVIEAEGIQMPYGVYVVFGMLLLQAFLDALSRPVGLIKRSSGLVTQVKVAPESLLMAQLMGLLFTSYFSVPIMLFVALVLGAFDPLGFAAFLFLYPAMVLLGFSVSVALAPLNAVYADIQNVVRSLNRPLLFLCPTFYRPGQEGSVLGRINDYNPIAIVMNNLRLLATEGQWHSFGSFAVVVGVSCGLLVLAFVFFHLSVPVLAERI